MAKGASIQTRINADVAAAAAAVAPSEHRTVAEQINYWARIGMQVERSRSVASRRVLEVAAGHVQFSTFTSEDRTAAHAIIDAEIAERVAKQRFGPAARTAGQTTVSIDEDGNLIEIAPDGSRHTL